MHVRAVAGAPVVLTAAPADARDHAAQIATGVGAGQSRHGAPLAGKECRQGTQRPSWPVP